MANLRKEARGRECQVRLVGVCNHNPETVVLAHYRMAGLTGIGQKADDVFGAYCCHACHLVIDGAVNSKYSRDELKLAHLEGILRTQKILINEGKIKW